MGSWRAACAALAAGVVGALAAPVAVPAEPSCAISGQIAVVAAGARRPRCGARGRSGRAPRRPRSGPTDARMAAARSGCEVGPRALDRGATDPGRSARHGARSVGPDPRADQLGRRAPGRCGRLQPERGAGCNRLGAGPPRGGGEPLHAAIPRGGSHGTGAQAWSLGGSVLCDRCSGGCGRPRGPDRSHGDRRRQPASAARPRPHDPVVHPRWPARIGGHPGSAGRKKTGQSRVGPAKAGRPGR